MVLPPRRRKHRNTPYGVWSTDRHYITIDKMIRFVPLVLMVAVCLAQEPIAPHSALEPSGAKAAASLSASTKDSPPDLLTTSEKTNWEQTGPYSEAVDIAHKLERASRFVKVQ